MVAAVVLFAFGAATAILAWQLPLGTVRMPGSGSFPLVLGAALMVLSAIRAWTVHREQPAEEPAKPVEAGTTRRVALFMGIVALSTALLQTIGYVASGFLLMTGLLKVLGVGWARSVLIGACSAAGSWLLFVYWLRIPMPAGLAGF